jgi:hypothetical protein
MTIKELEQFADHILSPCEIECRVAALRINMTPSERRESSPVEALLAEEAATKRFVQCLKEFLRI